MKIETNIILVLLGLSLVTAFSAEPETYYCGGKPADVYFLLDSSTSIWYVDYEKQLQFVSSVIDIFDVGPNRTRIGMGLFSDYFNPQIGFGDYNNKTEINQVILETKQKMGGTNTAVAIREMREGEFNSNVARQDVAHIAIILTDGKSWDPKETAFQAKLTKEKGIYIFAIGIGGDVDTRELRNIASKSENDNAQFVFHVKNFDALDSIKNILAIKTCEVVPKDQPRCATSTKSDIIFALDPLVMGQSRTEIIKEFIANTANQIDMGDSKPIRIGVFTNNCPSSKDIHLNEHGNKFTFIQELRSNNKMTKTHILKRVRRRGFTKANGGRADARRLIVTFVDGPLDNSKDVFLEAERVRKFNMDVFVIAIGNEVKENELRKLASVRPKEHIFRVTSYDNLKISFNDFIDKICEFL
ncbi:COL6A [Acanthosepion pharaonis]|uniref:COL6A n=1 Tax=Acanthosepion pharaonis TaxID=158019 RepID=A0A812BWZ8_ACAPH|nr:COL6A [Sepia pharaonis]